MSKTLWTTQYAPQTFAEVAGNPQTVEQIAAWGKAWSMGQTQPPLIMHGPSGCGKTVLCAILAKTFDFELLEWSPSETRDQETLLRVMENASQSQSFSQKKRLIVFEEVDAIMEREDKGGLSTMINIAKNSKNPVVFTLNDLYADKKLAPLRTLGLKAEFRKPTATQVSKLLERIALAEQLDYDLPSLQQLAQNSQGDFRAAVLDLQSLAWHNKKITMEDVESLGGREKSSSIFDVLPKIFHAKTVKESQQARMSVDVDPNLLIRWMEENIPRHFNKPNADFSRAFDYLSKSDVFSGRIQNRQHYGFLKYSQELATSGVGIQREASYPGFMRYQFPMLLSQLASSSSARQKKKSIAQKMQKISHGSWRKLATDLDWMKLSCGDSVEKWVPVAAVFEFDESDLAFLTGKKEDSKFVEKIITQANDIRLKHWSAKRHAVQETENQEEIVEKVVPETVVEKPKPDEKQTRLFGF